MTGGLLVVGGGPAGHSAAGAFRAAGGAGPVRIISSDSSRPYHRPPLSKEFLRGDADPADVMMEDLSFYRDRDIDLRLSEEVVSLDLDERLFTTNGAGPSPFDQCVLALGSTPAALQVPGLPHPAVHQLRSIDEASRLRDASGTAERVTVIGSGFIGCEAAASLAGRGLQVVMVTTERRPQAGRLGTLASERIDGWLRAAGVQIIADAQVRAIRNGTGVLLADGREYFADLVLVATGVTPNSRLASAAGLTMATDGRIEVDEFMRTSARGIYAAGDVVQAFHPIAGRHLAVEHWGDAISMGEVAGRHAAGEAAAWNSVPGFWSDIGGHQLKFAAWGDGYDEIRPVEHPDGGFTVWYGTAGRVVGVLTYRADADYEQGTATLLASGPLP